MEQIFTGLMLFLSPNQKQREKSAPDPAKELTLLPQILSLDLRGLLLNGGEGKWRMEGEGR